MLKKRIVVATIALSLSLPAVSSATPLNGVPQLDIIAKVSRFLGFFSGHPGTSARPAHDHRKNGCGMDPTGSTCPAPIPTSGATSSTTDTPTGQ